MVDGREENDPSHPPRVRTTMNASATPRTATDPSLIQAHLELIRLVSRLQVLGRRLDATRRYLAEPGSNAPLGQGCLTSTTAEYGATLGHLRAVRSAAYRLLAA
jgi:hypothetical protein